LAFLSLKWSNLKSVCFVSETCTAAKNEVCSELRWAFLFGKILVKTAR
jgi:hypothetical protein